MKSSDVVRALAPADQAGEDDPLSALMYPLRFLGMGLLIAWLCCTHVASIFPGDVFDPRCARHSTRACASATSAHSSRSFYSRRASGG